MEYALFIAFLEAFDKANHNILFKTRLDTGALTVNCLPLFSPMVKVRPPNHSEKEEQDEIYREPCLLCLGTYFENNDLVTEE